MRRTALPLLAVLAVSAAAITCGPPGGGDEPVVTSISGKVQDADTLDAIADALIQTEPSSTQVTTDTQGAFAIEDLTPDTSYRVTATRTGYDTSSVTVTTIEGENVIADILLEPDKPTSITGRVKDADTDDPIANALVQTEPFVKQAFTNQEGVYSIEEGLDIGTTYRVTASKTGYNENSVTISNIQDGENTVADILLQAEGPELTLSTSSVQINAGSSSGSFLVSNSGDQDQGLEWAATSPDAWVTGLSPASGTVTSMDAVVTISIDRALLPAGADDVNGTVNVTSNGGSGMVALKVIR